ncbi:MAG: DUF4303 domain-containing protein [Lachnospiraceae bacterium]|nr:DUF4303 domain-containing protein [Lachnospiraceae bacterium]
MCNYEEQLVNLFETAAGKAFAALTKEHENEHFYYFSLMMDECLRPYISAWSREALEQFFTKNAVPQKERARYRWSGENAPYEAYGWDEYFVGHLGVLEEREHWADLSDDEDAFDEALDEEWELRLGSMEEAMRRLDQKGAFGTGAKREQVVISVELIPPEQSNYERTARLNQSGLIAQYLAENTNLPDENGNFAAREVSSDENGDFAAREASSAEDGEEEG